MALHMASRTDSNSLSAPKGVSKAAKPSTKLGLPLKRLASYLYLKLRAFRSPSEYVLFMEVISILDLIPDSEKASLLVPRTTRNRTRPITPTSKEIQDFNTMRSVFLNGVKRKASSIRKILQPQKSCSHTGSPFSDMPDN
ncbi:hypothetical protein L211DRAFT_848522 [Terfezia boudieri ATCC MYA-4762]|uniref:Uncharacterized protein n=1 Tax=Terfezia boudieri ATCC MYA-4762 TaxID=1051890 RepID=A0A3N4LP39_9PEZI|nr:hypothetical protein L211DRAFT_848522 [Terfezia boudieri ATCC MYA-4762]